jgi:streptolysin S family bacteriocin protoxin
MKRLVTQFDDARTRATVATPTCCCCCCCCCVGSILTATGVSALDANELAVRAQLPAGPRRGYVIGALSALPLAAVAASVVGGVLADVDDMAATLAGFGVLLAVWPALLTLIYRRLGARETGKAVGVTVIVCSLLFAAEFLGGLFLLLSGLFPAYLLIAVGLPWLAVPLLRKWIAV